MLFLLKRTVADSLLALVVLAGLGMSVRHIQAQPVLPACTWPLALAGVVVGGVVLCSDALLHGGLWLLFGSPYLRRYEQLAGVFRGQSYPAMLCGALMAGVGEELVFRGCGSTAAYLLPAAVLFGLLHHVRWELWPFTLWSIWEGTLFALARLWTGQLLPTMVAHFLHDVTGFLIFHHLNRKQQK
jgi:membrane protease YdiL (CAAX protease family)